jgi:hypothetical protein
VYQVWGYLAERLQHESSLMKQGMGKLQVFFVQYQMVVEQQIDVYDPVAVVSVGLVCPPQCPLNLLGKAEALPGGAFRFNTDAGVQKSVFRRNPPGSGLKKTGPGKNMPDTVFDVGNGPFQRLFPRPEIGPQTQVEQSHD